MHLDESYGGLSENPNTDCAYYCYTIYDSYKQKFYSGVRLNKNSGNCDLLTQYFTSSTDVDFKGRVKEYPLDFTCHVEYFNTPEEAYRAESEFHKKHDVASNPLFYNKMNAPTLGMNWIGTVSCRTKDGDVYVVTTDEFRTGDHDHTNAGMVCVYDLDTDQNLMVSQLEFYSDDRYVSVISPEVPHNKKTVAVYDMEEHRHKKVAEEDYYQHPLRYVSAGIKKLYLVGDLAFRRKKDIPEGCNPVIIKLSDCPEHITKVEK